jgi:hypothetical protein
MELSKELLSSRIVVEAIMTNHSVKKKEDSGEEPRIVVQAIMTKMQRPHQAIMTKMQHPHHSVGEEEDSGLVLRLSYF